jgi:hypothetical protein
LLRKRVVVTQPDGRTPIGFAEEGDQLFK